MMFWELNLTPKRQLLNRNFWSYHVGYHVWGALTIEINATTCWNEKSDLSAKNCLNRQRHVLDLGMMFWELNLRLKGKLLNRNFGSYHVVYHVCGALSIEMSGTTCWNEKPNTFFASEKKELRFNKIAFYAFSKRFQRKKAFYIDNGNVFEFKMLLNRNLWTYHVGYHVFGAQTIEISGTTCPNEKPNTFFACE